MTRNPTNSQDRLAEEIRRQIGSDDMARFIKALPSFQADETIPYAFKLLLAELDGAELRSRKN